MNLTEKTFLYVEDDPLSREALKVLFTRVMGVKQFDVFEDSRNFMARVNDLPAVPDLILLDIHVAPYDGFEMLTMLRATPVFQTVPVVALTASVMNEEVALLKQKGFDGVMGKPIDVRIFPQLIERVLQGEAIWHISA